MALRTTPGVYIEEISLLPPSVAEVSTAIPAFVGYTERPAAEPMRITSMLEFQATFGGASPSTFKVTRQSETDDTVVAIERVSPDTEYLLYDSLSLYFRNGGGPCWVISVGQYGDAKAKADFSDGLDLVSTLDEPTLIMLTDATTLAPADYYDLVVAALDQCNTLGDRFVIIDVVPTNDNKDVDTFRNRVASDYLRYGAAYYPYLSTTLNYAYTDDTVRVVTVADPDIADDTPKLSTMAAKPIYNTAKGRILGLRVGLPPSPAIAGVYARVDRDRGVWKSPANVALAAVIGPTRRLTDAQQESLNVHETGKSINAIREFTGRGTMVWGARTLAGNDNEWRYISVRRLFNMIEESTRKATAFAVFESNTVGTWLKVRAMVESYLYGLWQRGALAGATPEAAYVVNVGLGKTMTADDVLNGRMIVEIGVAAVRPAEFIYLRFMHKLQES